MDLMGVEDSMVWTIWIHMETKVSLEHQNHSPFFVIFVIFPLIYMNIIPKVKSKFALAVLLFPGLGVVNLSVWTSPVDPISVIPRHGALMCTGSVPNHMER